MKRPCLPLPTIQAATTKILPTKCLNIAEPQIFCPPKFTRYTIIITGFVCLLIQPALILCVQCFMRVINNYVHRYGGREGSPASAYRHNELSAL